MPGGDRRGPAGMGPMTGRAAGYCAGYDTPGFANPGPGGRGFGRGFGGGRGFGRGRGFGWGRGAFYGPGPYFANPPQMDPGQESEYLKSEIKAMEEEIKAMKKRMEELGKQEK